MAKHVRRTPVASFICFEAILGANEVLLLPVNRSASKNGDSTIAIAAPTGTSVSATIEHPAVVQEFLKGNRYASTIAGDYPATAAPAAVSSFWYTSVAIAASIVELKMHATALLITAPAGGGRVIVYGDY